MPGAFALGGVVFPWYLWPSRFLYQALVVSFVVVILREYKFHAVAHARTVLIIFLAASLVFQLLLSYNTGRQEMGFRASVGQYISRISNPGDTLFLEPAGYIPYYAGITTIDEVGLTSNAVLLFKKSDPSNWWISTVKNKLPTFLVQRDHILVSATYQGVVLDSEDAQWLWNNYSIIETFSYNPDEWANFKLLQWVLRHGSHATYHVLKLRNGEP